VTEAVSVFVETGHLCGNDTEGRGDGASLLVADPLFQVHFGQPERVYDRNGDADESSSLELTSRKNQLGLMNRSRIPTMQNMGGFSDPHCSALALQRYFLRAFDFALRFGLFGLGFFRTRATA
jgi:hypothetical protein